ncbi:MAG: ribosomal protein S18-alanine N-acetyltransferase [Clostridiales bacterium]|nr:ribosomal protein S18-alanine N-acetyltransferase [Clostridiales bacterium]
MVEIREMQLDDLEQVMVIENENFSRPWTETGFFSFLIRQDTLFLVAEEEEKILGYCGVVMVQDEGDITNVAVANERQNQGIGKKLVEELIRRTEEAGVRQLYLEVRASNERAIHVYEKMGFVRNGLRKNYYEDPVEDGLLMKHVSGNSNG